MAGTALRGRLTWQTAKVSAVAVETASVRTLTLDVPDWPGHQAGQHLDIRLTGEDGYVAERSYSIASAPGEPVAITVERLDDGEVSPYLTDELRAGDDLELRGPIGGYFVWEPEDGGPLLLLAGGSGVVPLRSILRYRERTGSTVPVRLLYSSRTLDDVIYQAYFIAYLVIDSLNVPLNPGNPYITSATQNGFATLGQPDIAATLAAVAAEAIKAVWYQKWWVHLRHRPESGGGIVYLTKTGQGGTQGQVSNTALNSQAVQNSFTANNSYFLSQAFPEGSPMHPAYPTGHGTVAGACITALKFFFDGAFKIPKPAVVVPSANGATVAAYAPPPGEPQLTVNGELHKLAHNVSFGHGIHAGIHWRSDTDTSIQLGEAVALSWLQDRAHAYNERFSVTLTKVDGTTATISNP